MSAANPAIAPKNNVWRLAALALFALVPLLLIALTLSNFLDGLEARGEARRQQELMSTIVAKLSHGRADHVSAEEIAKLYLASPTEGLAAAELQTLATDLVRQAGGRLNEVQPNDAPDQKSDHAVSLMLSLDIDNAGLLDLVYAIETALPLIDVTDLNIRRVDRDDGLGADSPLLKVDMTVAARWRASRG